MSLEAESAKGNEDPVMIALSSFLEQLKAASRNDNQLSRRECELIESAQIEDLWANLESPKSGHINASIGFVKDENDIDDIEILSDVVDFPDLTIDIALFNMCNESRAELYNLLYTWMIGDAEEEIKKLRQSEEFKGAAKYEIKKWRRRIRRMIRLRLNRIAKELQPEDDLS